MGTVEALKCVLQDSKECNALPDKLSGVRVCHHGHGVRDKSGCVAVDRPLGSGLGVFVPCANAAFGHQWAGVQ